jgi:hypothetical protein
MLRRFSDEMRDLAAAETPADGVALLEWWPFFSSFFFRERSYKVKPTRGWRSWQGV